MAFAALPLGPGDAADGPVLLPTRDVAVSYRQEQGGQVLEERLRWSAATRRMRLDGPGNFFIFDYAAQRGGWGRENDRTWLDLERAAAPGPPSAAAGAYVRTGSDRIAGAPCTEWALRDSAPETRICLTDDGVMLRMQIVGRMDMTATDIRYGAQDPSLFQVPAGYTHLGQPK